MISKIKSSIKSFETYIIIAVAGAGVIQYFIASNTGAVPDVSPVRVLAELKAYGIHDLDVNTIIAMTESMKQTAQTSTDNSGVFGLITAAFLAVVNIVNRVALKYKELSIVYQEYGDIKDEIANRVSTVTGPKVVDNAPNLAKEVAKEPVK